MDSGHLIYRTDEKSHPPPTKQKEDPRNWRDGRRFPVKKHTENGSIIEEKAGRSIRNQAKKRKPHMNARNGV